MSWVQDVHHFWFGELGPADWFVVKSAVDDAIRGRFAPLYETLKASPPSPATLDARGHLAAVIVFDQFPRNLFRHTAQAFASDALALAVSRDAVARGMDEGLGPHERQFLYMPFMHSEDAKDQAACERLFATLDVPEAVRSAREHKQIIDRFGRFPYRNQALGRVSSAEEEAFLKTKPSWP